MDLLGLATRTGKRWWWLSAAGILMLFWGVIRVLTPSDAAVYAADGAQVALPEVSLEVPASAVSSSEKPLQGKCRRARFPCRVSDQRFAHLSHLLKVSERIYCGGEPRDAAAFQALRALGCRTIVSVDGAVPKVAMAKKHGLRYVHVPIGYDGVTSEESRMITAIVRRAKGPYYIHCHHGKHRGPAAAAIACIADRSATGEDALRILAAAGTDKNYAGLWRSVSEFVAPSTCAELPELAEVADVSSLASAMSRIDRITDELRLCESAGWKSPADHTDLSPVQQALLLKEAFREAGRQLDATAHKQFESWMRESERLAEKLQSQLSSKVDTAKAQVVFQQLQDQCRRCHELWR